MDAEGQVKGVCFNRGPAAALVWTGLNQRLAAEIEQNNRLLHSSLFAKAGSPENGVVFAFEKPSEVAVVDVFNLRIVV